MRVRESPAKRERNLRTERELCEQAGWGILDTWVGCTPPPTLVEYRGTSLIRKRIPSGPYSRPDPACGPDHPRAFNTWKREFKLPWRKAGLLRHLDDVVDSDQ